MEPATVGPVEPLYFSALTAPVRNVAWLAEFDTDTAVVSSSSVSGLSPAGLYGPMEFGAISRISLGSTRHRYASVPFVTHETDSPALTPIEGRLRPIFVERYLQTEQNGAYGTTAVNASGEVTLSNEDGELDLLLGDDDMALEGREIRVSVAPIGEGDVMPKLSDFSQVFSGIIDTLSWSRERVTIRITDDRLKLAQAVQQRTYNGGGGIDGPATLAGVTRPLAFGRCSNVTPILVDPFELIYQFHDGEALSVETVRDSGVDLEKWGEVETYDDLLAVVADDPAGETGEESPFNFGIGQFVAAPKIGCFKLGGLPAGRVTADVRGYGGVEGQFRYFSDGRSFADGRGFAVTEGIVHARTAPQVAITLLQRGGVSNINVAQFAQLDNDEPRDVGLYLEAGGNRTLGDCLNYVLAGNSTFLMKSGDGVYQLRRLLPPGIGIFELGTDMIVKGAVERMALPWKQPWSRWKVRYDRNWTPLQDSEIVPAVDSTQRVYLQRETTEADIVDDVTAVVYPDRGAGVLDTALVTTADARAQGHRMRTFYARRRKMIRLEAKGITFRADLGDTVRVRYPRYDVNWGWPGVVVGLREDGRSGTTTLTLFG